MTVLEKMELIKKIMGKDIEVLIKGISMNIWKKNRKYVVNQRIESSGTILLFNLDKSGLEQLLNTILMNLENNFSLEEKESRFVISEEK